MVKASSVSWPAVRIEVTEDTANDLHEVLEEWIHARKDGPSTADERQMIESVAGVASEVGRILGKGARPSIPPLIG